MTSVIGRANKFDGSKEEVVQHFEKEAKDWRKEWLKQEKLQSTVSRSVYGAEKFDRLEGSIPLHCLKSVLLKDMHVDKTHRGLYIKLRVISSVKIVNSVEVMVEDDDGNFTFLAIYNMIPLEVSSSEQWRVAEELLPKGSFVNVKEPFLKVRLDQTVGIRVDNPKDLVFEAEVIAPKSYQEWKAEGNALLKLNDPEATLSCYHSALKCLVIEDKLIFLSLLNISLCSLNLRDFRDALLYAFAAVVVGEKSAVEDNKGLLCKAYFRLHESAQALGEDALAEWSVGKLRIVDEDFWKKEFKTKKKYKHESQSDCVRKIFEAVTPSVFSIIKLASSEVVDIDEDSMTAKEEGALLYKQKDYQGAKSRYLAALRSNKLMDSYADILSNLSLCTPEDPHDCSSLLIASLCINPLSETSILQLCDYFLQSDLNTAALSLCQVGLKAFSFSPAFTLTASKLKEKIEIVKASGMKNSKIKYPTNVEKQMEIDRVGKNESLTLEETKAFNAFRGIIPQLVGSRKQDPGFEKMLKLSQTFASVPFHLEYKKAKILPPGCDPYLCHRKLDEGFEFAKVHRLHTLALVEGNSDGEPRKIHERFGSIARQPDFNSWHSAARPGSYWHSTPRQFQTIYLQSALQAFSNGVYKPGVVETGTCQVAIGFVDLNSLIYNDLEVSEGTFRWVGYEMSPYSVAKTLVLADMMKTTQAEAVLQVWYSSAWARTTEEAFLKSVTNVLRAGDQDEEVLSFLSHWLTNRVTLKQARQLRLSIQTESCMRFASFTRDTDRKALCSYFLSGQLLDGDIASTVMFCNPPGCGYLALHLNFLQTIYYPLLADKWGRSQADIISVGISIVLDKILTWSQHVKAGLVDIVVRRKEVKLDPSLIREISSFQPSLVYWSNVSDYIHPPSVFFQIVKEISSSRTVHQFYSMNWPQYCFGTYAIDYSKTLRLDMIHRGEDLARDAIVTHKLQHLLITSDIITNAINTSCFYLATRFYRRWLTSFLRAGGLSDSQILYAELQDYNLFQRG